MRVYTLETLSSASSARQSAFLSPRRDADRSVHPDGEKEETCVYAMSRDYVREVVGQGRAEGSSSRETTAIISAARHAGTVRAYSRTSACGEFIATLVEEEDLGRGSGEIKYNYRRTRRRASVVMTVIIVSPATVMLKVITTISSLY